MKIDNHAKTEEVIRGLTQKFYRSIQQIHNLFPQFRLIGSFEENISPFVEKGDLFIRIEDLLDGTIRVYRATDRTSSLIQLNRFYPDAGPSVSFSRGDLAGMLYYKKSSPSQKED